MTIGSESIKFEVELLDASGNAGTVSVTGSLVTVSDKSGNKTKYRISEIKMIEPIYAEHANVPQGIRGAVLGGLLGGPIGAFAGASMGKLLRETQFLVHFVNGRTLHCKSLTQGYEVFAAHHKVLGARFQRMHQILDVSPNVAIQAIPIDGADRSNPHVRTFVQQRIRTDMLVVSAKKPK